MIEQIAIKNFKSFKDVSLTLQAEKGNLGRYVPFITAGKQKWLDLTAGEYDFFRGADSTATTDDPTFNGTPGNKSVNEYWSFDGGDFFAYDSANEAWMETLHKDNSKFCVLAIFYANNISIGPGSNTASAATGTDYGVDLSIQGGGAGGGSLRIIVDHNNITTYALNKARGDNEASSDTWTFQALVLDEAGVPLNRKQPPEDANGAFQEMGGERRGAEQGHGRKKQSRGRCGGKRTDHAASPFGPPRRPMMPRPGS